MPFGNPDSYQSVQSQGQPSKKEEDSKTGVLLSTEEYQKVYNLLAGLNEAIPATEETTQVKQQIAEVLNLLGGKMNQAPTESGVPQSQPAA